MQLTNIRQIKAAVRDQAFIGSTLVYCPIGRVVAIRRRKGQLLAMIRGWGVRWYAVESVTIEVTVAWPCSASRKLQDVLPDRPWGRARSRLISHAAMQMGALHTPASLT